MKKIAMASIFLFLGFFYLYSLDKNPFSKVLIQLGEKKLVVEVANTPETRAQGLMFRKTMAENDGMLFVFEQAEYQAFWMKNTSIPLDIGYFDENQRLIEVFQMEPFSEKPVNSTQKSLFALEMNQGWFEKNKIKKGTRFKLLKKLTKN